MTMDRNAMFDGPRQYLNEFVIPNVAEYSRNSANKRTALNAVLSTHHLADWLYAAKGGRAGSYWSPILKSAGSRQSDAYAGYLASQCAFVETIRLIANGTKHVFESGKHIEPVVHTPAPDTIGPVGTHAIGTLYQPPPYIIAVHDGINYPLEEILRHAVKWWPGFLEQHGC